VLSPHSSVVSPEALEIFEKVSEVADMFLAISSRDKSDARHFVAEF